MKDQFLMRVKVTAGPDPIVTPADIPGPHASNDAAVTRMITAAQRTFDGPKGWLHRAIGKQTIAMSLDGWSHCRDYIRLPYPPLLEVVSVKYFDAEDTEQTLVDTSYVKTSLGIWFKPPFTQPGLSAMPDPVTITYEAGYEPDDVPPEAKEAVILMVQHLKAIGVENLFLRSEEVEGIGTFQYTVSDQAGEVIRKASENLLQGLRVYV